MATDNQSVMLDRVRGLHGQWDKLKDELFNHEAFGLNWNRVCRHLWAIEDMVGRLVVKEWEVERKQRLATP